MAQKQHFDPAREYRNERMDQLTYVSLAAHERDPATKTLMQKLAAVEKGHAASWKTIAERHGVHVKELGTLGKLRIRWYVLFRRALGLTFTVRLLEMHEMTAIREYGMALQDPGLTEQERQTLSDVLNDEKIHEQQLIDHELNTNPQDVRDAIYGINDALVEVLASTSGLAGVLVKPLLVAAGGSIVGASGMLSMAAGAYMSTKSEEAAKESSGPAMSSEKSKALKSALMTLLFYALGVIPPVAPYAVGIGGLQGMLASYLLSGVSLFLVGSLVGIMVKVPALKRGAEMAGIGLGAAVLTYGIGLFARQVLGLSV
ncbi:MAG: VIT1/CCC1 family protein [TACK group archaeon]|nr:VIT1/CCC1 family protein [TACK group archaeon]